MGVSDIDISDANNSVGGGVEDADSEVEEAESVDTTF